MILIKTMQQLSGKINEGYFIAKQTIKVNTLSIDGKIELKSAVEKSKRFQSMFYSICNCEVKNVNKSLLELKTTLIKKSHYDFEKKFTHSNSKEFFRSVSKNEVKKFCDLSCDHNYIHKGSNPVVQAMLILLLLEDYLALRNIYMYNCEITYITPIIADSNIFLCWQSSQKLLGITDNIICFKLEFSQK